MDEIRQIYCGDSYTAFLDYCDRHHYRQMRDLMHCRFKAMAACAHLSPALLSRIKTIFVLYVKKHPEYFPNAKPARAKAAPPADLSDKLLEIFKQNGNKLIHITEITKAIGKGVKRSDIIQVLEQEKWCRIVDGTTFFYQPQE